LDAFSCALVKVAGEVGERMAAGATSTSPLFNRFAEGGDAEDARHFIASLGGDELDSRRWAVVRSYALLRTRWAAVQELASRLERHRTILGERSSESASKSNCAKPVG